MKFNGFLAGNAPDKGCFCRPFLKSGVGQNPVAKQPPPTAPVGGGGLGVWPGVRVGEHESGRGATHLFRHESL